MKAELNKYIFTCDSCDLTIKLNQVQIWEIPENWGWRDGFQYADDAFRRRPCIKHYCPDCVKKVEIQETFA